jgi:flagellar motor protein MotB
MFRRRLETDKRNGEEENPFLLSFSDLMASLLAIFILALVVMMIQLNLQKRKLEEDSKKIVVIREEYEIMLKEKEALEKERTRIRLVLEELRKSLNEIEATQREVVTALEGVGIREKSLTAMLEEIQKDLKAKGIEVIVSENGTVLRIPEKALSFGLNRFEIQERFRPAANLIGSVLLKALQNEQNRSLLDTVFIEGHTDAVPNRREMGNWGLSTYRAISLWLYWTDQPGNNAELKQLKSVAKADGNTARPLISTSGYAETRPTGTPLPEPLVAEDPGNPADRRIDIRFTLASQEKKDLAGLKDKLQTMKSKTDELINKLEGLE